MKKTCKDLALFLYLCSMKKKIPLLLALLIIFVAACQNREASEEYQQHKQELLRIRKISKQHKSIAGETQMDSLLWFFDKKGTESDRFMAHFYYAHYMNDANVTDCAYKEFEKTLELAPKKKGDLEKDELRSIYSNLQYLCRKDHNYEEANKWWEEANKSKVFTTPYLYDLYFNKAYNFLSAGKSDSCAVYLNKAYKNLLEGNWDENKSWCIDQLAPIYAVMGKTENFKQCLHLLLEHPYHRNGESSTLHIGLFYAQIGMRDSADYYLRRALDSSTDIAIEAAVQLAISFRNRQENDSVFSYYQKTVSLMEVAFQEKDCSYTREQEVSKRVFEKEMKVAEQRTYILTLALISVLAILLSIISYRGVVIYRQRFMNTKEKLDEAENKKNELEQLLQHVLDQYEQAKEDEAKEKHLKKEQRYRELIAELEYKAGQRVSADSQTCSELLQLWTALHSDAYTTMKSQYPRIKSTDFLICILATNGFSTSQIAALLDYESPEIYHFMQRISKGLSGTSVGRINDFRDLVASYFA